jgi:hypothetical protein
MTLPVTLIPQIYSCLLIDVLMIHLNADVVKSYMPLCNRCARSDFYNNLRGTSFEDKLCQPTIDVVYTWVNGSDDRLLAGTFISQMLGLLFF